MKGLLVFAALLISLVFFCAPTTCDASSIQAREGQEKYYWFQQIWNLTLPRPPMTNNRTFPTGLGPIEGWAYDYLSGNFIVQQNGPGGNITAFESFDNVPPQGPVTWSVNVNDLGCSNVLPVSLPYKGHNRLHVVENYNPKTGGGDSILLFNCNHWSYAGINARNGSVLWIHKAAEASGGSTMKNSYVGNNSMVFYVQVGSSIDAPIYMKCIDILTGAEKWKRSIDSLFPKSGFPFEKDSYTLPEIFPNPTPTMTNRRGDSVFAVRLRGKSQTKTVYTGLSVNNGDTVYHTIVNDTAVNYYNSPAICERENYVLIPNDGVQVSALNISDGTLTPNLISSTISNLNISQLLCEGGNFYVVANQWQGISSGTAGTVFMFPLQPGTISSWNTEFNYLTPNRPTLQMYLAGGYALLQTGNFPGHSVILDLKDGSQVQSLGWACKSQDACVDMLPSTSPITGLVVPETNGDENVVLTSMQTTDSSTGDILNVPVTVATRNGKVSVAAPFSSSTAEDGPFNFFYVPTAGSQAPRVFMWNWRTVWFGLSGW